MGINKGLLQERREGRKMRGKKQRKELSREMGKMPILEVSKDIVTKAQKSIVSSQKPGKDEAGKFPF